MSDASPETLYHRLLGEEFSRLSPILKRFHSSPNGGFGTGVFAVERPRRWFDPALGMLLRLPAAQSAAPIRLSVVVDSSREVWNREILGTSLKTVQFERGGLLVERMGPISFGMRVSVVEGGLVFRTIRAWALGIALPHQIAPSVSADVCPTDRGWTVRVRLELPIVGQVLSYEGKVIPE